MRLLKKLHDMEDEMKDGHTLFPKHNADSLNAVKNYMQNRSDYFETMGDTIEQINRNNNVATALFQGDVILTKEQAKEILEDINESEGSGYKRQAFRDHTYPKSLWSKGVFYSFHLNTGNKARRVFRKAATLWSSETCINFKESNAATDRINVIRGGGCWSNIGRLGGVQSLSLGQGCESVGTAAHEIGHALGLFHTQTRHDRDITLHRQNILVILELMRNIDTYQ
uniref:Metalloendopeptidase n=1 Tax=Angiostrongylus cantonensis TaxID=6313 RepID=A0A0K0D8T1_ANGCA